MRLTLNQHKINIIKTDVISLSQIDVILMKYFETLFSRVLLYV